MGKKTEKLHRLVNDLALRYGESDSEVLRLKAELDALRDIEVETLENRATVKATVKAKFDFRSKSRRLYQATTAGDLRHRH